MDWHQSEYDEDVVVARAAGLELAVGTDAFWMVKATAQVSEYPELWDAGQSSTIEAAKAAAVESWKRACRSYGPPRSKEQMYG